MMCFVICPIGSEGSDERCHSDNLFHDVIEPALLEIDLFDKDGIIRADKVENPGSINDQVIDLILNSNLIVADLSFHNPNAFYELGIADHAGKPVILFSRKGERIPFDKSNDRVIMADLRYYHERRKAREVVTKFAKAALHENHKVSNPVTQAKAYHEFQASADPKEKMIAELQRRVSTLEASSFEQPIGRSDPTGSRVWDVPQRSSALGLESANQMDDASLITANPTQDRASFLKYINESISASYANVLNEKEIEDHVRATLKLTAKDRVIHRICRIAKKHPHLARQNGEYIQILIEKIEEN